MTLSVVDANNLFLEGSLALARAESNGIRIDVPYLERTSKELEERISRGEEVLRSGEVWKQWKRRFGGKANLESGPQLGEVLFDILGLTPVPPKTPTGLYKTDEKILAKVDHPWLRNFLKLKKLRKVKRTYIDAYLREVWDGVLHPFFNLATSGRDSEGDKDKGGAKSFRISSSKPNFHNIPSRNPEQGKIARTAFIPFEDCYIVEVDFKAIEVGVAASVTQDPALIEYVSNPKSDMHKDTAADLFLCPKELISKQLRYCAKNQFVFAEFYGSYYKDCAAGLWESMEGMTLTDGTPIREHLASKGIKELGECREREEPEEGTFEYHVQKVEKIFWGKRFKVYAKWKRDWYESYKKTGEFQTVTGFPVRGIYTRNQCTNLPIQGPAYHCLLWCHNRIQRWIDEEKKRTRLLGEIHDSLISSTHRMEIQDYLTTVKRVTEVELRKAWDWIKVPMTVEIEASDVNWYSKTPWVCRNGVWGPEKDD